MPSWAPGQGCTGLPLHHICTTGVSRGVVEVAEMDKPWVPPSVRGTEREAAFLSPREGIPLDLQPSLLQWVNRQVSISRVYNATQRTWHVPYLRKIERAMQVPLGYDDKLIADTLATKADSDPEFFLDLIDYLLCHPSGHGAPRPPMHGAEMEGFLDQARSVWTVATRNGQAHLERRVDPTVTAAVEMTLSSGGNAADHLQRAWHAAYGRNPDPRNAQSEAIRAVEAASKQTIAPNDVDYTLGKAIGCLRDAPQKWVVEASAPAKTDRVETVKSMFELLWQGQVGRHGTPDLTVPVEPTPIEAQAAVHLATTLVQWFTMGVVYRSP